MSRFHFGEKAKIISGFYRGSPATIVDKRFFFYRIETSDYERRWVPYWVIESIDPKIFSEDFNKKLEKIVK